MRPTTRRGFAALTGGALATGLAGPASAKPVRRTHERDEHHQPQTTHHPAHALADGSAAVRVAHLSPDAPNVDVSVSGNRVLSDVPFGAVSDYLVLDQGTYHVRVRPHGKDQTVFDEHVSVASQAYTYAAIGELAGTNQPFEVARFVDDAAVLDGERARVRLIHASPDAPAVDVTVKGSDGVLFENVSFGGASRYSVVPAGTYTLQVRPHTPDNDGDVVASPEVSLDAGTVDTGFAVGYLAPKDAPADEPFRLVATTDSS